MSDLQTVHLAGSDGKLIRGDRIEGADRQILFITGFLSKRWGSKSQALAKWCREQGWGFCCYDVRGFGDSEGTFSDYSLSDWIADAWTVVSLLQDGPRLTIVGNSIGGWIAWLIAQDCSIVERLVLIAPAFNMMGERAKEISVERCDRWKTTGWMPWDDDPLHKDWPLAWQWVEESERYWAESFLKLRQVKTTILHGLQDRVIRPAGSWRFVEEVLRRDPEFPIELLLKTGDHRLSSPEHLATLRRLVTGE